MLNASDLLMSVLCCFKLIWEILVVLATDKKAIIRSHVFLSLFKFWRGLLIRIVSDSDWKISLCAEYLGVARDCCILLIHGLAEGLKYTCKGHLTKC